MFIPGTKIYDEIALQNYNDEEAEEAGKYQEIILQAFTAMTIEQIESEYERVERIRNIEEAVGVREGGQGKVPNVFDEQGKERAENLKEEAEETMVRFGLKRQDIAKISDRISKNDLIGKM